MPLLRGFLREIELCNSGGGGGDSKRIQNMRSTLHASTLQEPLGWFKSASTNPCCLHVDCFEMSFHGCRCLLQRDKHSCFRFRGPLYTCPLFSPHPALLLAANCPAAANCRTRERRQKGCGIRRYARNRRLHSRAGSDHITFNKEEVPSQVGVAGKKPKLLRPAYLHWPEKMPGLSRLQIPPAPSPHNKAKAKPYL